MKTVTAAKMKQIDAEAIEKYGIPSIVLMENAGRAVAHSTTSYLKNKANTVAIFCGKGNNGGDGLVCARHLINNNYKAIIYLLVRKTPFKADPAINMNILIKMKQKITEICDIKTVDAIKRNFKADLVVDAIFGTGFKGAPDILSSAVINFINQLNVPVISVDIPSGLDATSGKAYGSCIRAKRTITFGLPKKGLYKNRGSVVCGKIVVADIGLPNVRKLKLKRHET